MWFSNRRARLRKQLASTSTSYTSLGVVNNPYSTPSTPYAPITQTIPENSFGASSAAVSNQSMSHETRYLKVLNFKSFLFICLVPDLYPSHTHGHSASPNLPPLTSQHMPHHNHPYTSHPIYPTSNIGPIMPIAQNTTNSNNTTTSTLLNLPQNVNNNGNLQNLNHQGLNVTYKEENDHHLGESPSPLHHSYGGGSGNSGPTPASNNGLVTILGPNSGKF